VRVVSQEKGLYRVSNGQTEKPAEVTGRFRYDARTVSDYPAVGDYVIASWPEDGSNASISMLFPRKSCFMRKAAGNGRQEQVVAANIDVIFICMSLNNDFNLRRLERYIALAWDSGASPVIVLTKTDLCENLEGRLMEVESVAPGVDVISISSLKNDYDSVFAYLEPEKTVAFIGSSGVGKSTLINRLLGAELIETNGLRNDDKGRHTTTHRELIALPNGAYVIDTPGMRELGMWDNQEGIDNAFADVEELANACRFADCTHESEPGCAIRRALEEGQLDWSRWDSYLKLKRENAYAADGSTYLEAKKARFKEISRINKHNKKKK